MSVFDTSNATTPHYYMFRDVHAPGNFLVARLMSQVIVLISSAILCVFFVIVLKAFQKKQVHGQESKRFILGLLLGNLFFSILTTAGWNLVLTQFTGLEVEFCKYWARLGGALYVITNFFTYYILLMRCQAVGVIQGSGKIEKLIFKITLLAVKVGTMSVPLLAFVILGVFDGKTYFFEEYCVPGVAGWIAWLFLILDSGLSSGYLLLFILPVKIHMRKIRSLIQATEGVSAISTKSTFRSSGDLITASAVRNLNISSTAIGSTFIYMLGLALLSSFDGSEDNSILPYTHFKMWQLYGGALDIFVNAICIMMITKKLWASEPTRCRKIHNSRMSVNVKSQSLVG